HNADGVRFNIPAFEVRVQRPAGAHRRQPQHDAKRADGEAANMDEGVHEESYSSSIRDFPRGPCGCEISEEWVNSEQIRRMSAALAAEGWFCSWKCFFS